MFARNNDNKDKLSSKCKNCDKEYQEQRRRSTPEKQLNYGRVYQQKRRQDFNYRLQMLINASKQRAKKKNIQHTLTLEQLKEIYPQDNKCPVFGTVLEFGINSSFPKSSVIKINGSEGK